MLDYLKGTMIKQDWIFVGVSVLVLILLCVGYFLCPAIGYKAQGETLAQLDLDIEVTKDALKEANRINANIEDFEAEAEKWDALVSGFEQRLPDAAELPLLLSKFERLGTEMGVRVSLVPLTSQLDTNKITIPYKVTTFGTFHQIVGFINKLESDDRYLKVSEIDIREEKEFVSEATFTLSTYRFRQAAGESK